jgi:hypothetical protein
MNKLSGYQQAQIGLGAAAVAIALVGISFVASAQRGVCVGGGSPRSSTVLAIVPWAILVAGIVAVVFGALAYGRRAEDKRIRGPAFGALALGLLSWPCCQPVPLVIGGFVGGQTVCA